MNCDGDGLGGMDEQLDAMYTLAMCTCLYSHSFDDDVDDDEKTTSRMGIGQEV